MKRVTVRTVAVDSSRRGRPRVDERGSTVSVWVPETYHDRLCRLARQQDVSVSALVRSFLILKLK